MVMVVILRADCPIQDIATRPFTHWIETSERGWCLHCVVRISNGLKADMNSDILLQTAAIFFLSNMKQGFGSVYVMVDFICKGELEVWGTRVERELQNEKFLRTVGFEPGPFRLRSEHATTALRGMMSVCALKFTGFYLSVLF